jgi:DNA-binding MarR family transcriptional regulator
MDVAEQVFSIQQSYPRVYFACHTLHVRRRTTPHQLSPSDGNVLGHLDARRGIRPGDLAAHMSLSPSAMSATIARLQRLGYVARSRSSSDGRAAELRLTSLGVAAIQATSVLDTARLGMVLGKLEPEERAAAVRGLELLARGAHALLAEQGSATRWSRRSRPRRRSAGNAR